MLLFFTGFIVDHIVKNTIGKIIDGKTPEEISRMKFADISCGGGIFLVGAYDYLLNYHRAWYGATMLDAELKQQILLNNIYGLDIDPQAVQVTRLSLILKMLEEETASGIDNDLLAGLEKNIVCSNTLAKNPFAEETFDAVIGNPPYNAELSKDDRNKLTEKYPIGTTDTAALFMIEASRLIKKDGAAGLIVPKSFTYASNWAKTREHLLADLEEITDCSKVWKKVKLEMSIYISKKGSAAATFRSLVRDEDKFKFIANIDKETCREFGFIINGVSEKEIMIAKKMRASGKTFNDVVTNQRGGMFQNLVAESGPLPVWGGKQISKYGSAKDPKGYIDKEVLTDPKAFVEKDSILVQNIVAHVMNPEPHIVITATMPNCSSSLVILDTVNQLKNISDYDAKFILGVLNSKLVSWYTCKFVFANAIRTMHFDAPTTAKIPFPSIDLSNADNKRKHDLVVEKVRLILDDPELSASLESEIDQLVYSLFGLSAEEQDLCSSHRDNIENRRDL